MTKTIDVSGTLRYINEGREYNFARSRKFDWPNSAKGVELDQVIDNAVETPINLGDIANPDVPSWMMIENTDIDNFVLIRAAAGETPFAYVAPGDFAGPFRLAATAPTAQADTAPCRVRFLIVDKQPDP